MATTFPTYGAAAMLPDSLKVRPVTSYPTRPTSGKYNMQAFDMAGVPANYVAPPPPPPAPNTPNTPNIPNIPGLNLGGLFGGLGGINWQALLAQYGGLLGNKQPTPTTPTAPTATNQAISVPNLQGLLARINAGKGYM
jgi:hypothetical protein